MSSRNAAPSQKLKSRNKLHHHDQNHTLLRQPQDDKIWNSIASSSALVSESIVDSWPADERDHHNHRNDDDDDDDNSSFDAGHDTNITSSSTGRSRDNNPSRGINQHRYSPESIQRILEHQEQMNSNLFGQNEIDDVVDSDDADHRKILPSVANSVSRAAGSIFRWVEVQKIKRQKEALEKAVEAQRRILLQESLHVIRARDGVYQPDESMDTGLSANQTFQNITSKDRTLSAISFCGGTACVSDEEFAYDYDDESNVGFDEYINSVQNSHFQGGDDDQSGVSYDHSITSKSEQAFKIGRPCHTVSGQGVAVQLQYLDKRRTQAQSQSNQDESKINIQHEQSSVPFILTPDQMRTIALNGLPASIAFAKWKRLYCLQRDGDSFTTSFLRKVKGVERTLLVIKTTNDEVMGGYSNSPWESQGGSVGAAFYGSCQASLFKIDKHTNEVKIFPWSGSNRYVQVCDIHAKLIAFGGGGRDGAFGLCVEDDFAVGTSGSCETFNNEPLCEEGRFEILNVECWGFMASF